MNITYTKIWRIEHKLVIADTIEEAIEVYKTWAKSVGDFISTDITAIKAIGDNQIPEDFNALIKSLKDRVLSHPKQEWSEEDKKYLDAIEKLIMGSRHTGYNGVSRKDAVDWLKSLRPQNSYAYNPYKAVVESIAEMCKHYDKVTDLQDFYDNVVVKCKDAKEYDSLFPQNTWKPSDEQIIWLYRAADDASKDSRMKQVLNELLEQLKKLREE